MKTSRVTPIFKKEDRAQVTNYMPVNVLSSVSKIFERILHRQVISYVNQVLLPFVTFHGYTKGFSNDFT